MPSCFVVVTGWDGAARDGTVRVQLRSFVWYRFVLYSFNSTPSIPSRFSVITVRMGEKCYIEDGGLFFHSSASNGITYRRRNLFTVKLSMEYFKLSTD